MSARASEQPFLIVTFSSSYLGFTFLNIILRSPCQTCLGCSHYTGIAFAPARKPSRTRRLLFTHKDFDFGDFCNRLRVVPHFSLGTVVIVERAKRERS